MQKSAVFLFLQSSFVICYIQIRFLFLFISAFYAQIIWLMVMAVTWNVSIAKCKFFFFLVSLSSLAFSSPGKVLSPTKLTNADKRPVIDGLLDEEVWSKAQIISDFHQIKPLQFYEPSEKTEVRVMYDEHNIYIGAAMHDKDIENLNHGQIAHRMPLDFDDQLSITIDSFHNKRSAYLFQVNPNGSKFDSLITNNLYNPHWNAIWTAKSSIGSYAWQVEIAIPFKSISFDSGSKSWGINFARFIPRRKEIMAWSSRGQSTWEAIPAVAGSMSPIDSKHSGKGFDVVPSIVSTTVKAKGEGSTENDISPSLDILYKPVSSVSVAATFRPDFSYVELDDAVVNLSRFDVLLPEKRDFFLQDSNIFEFGSIQDNGLPFISRKLGLSLEGEPLRIGSGVKITGRGHDLNYGLMNITQDTKNGDSTNVQIARVTYDLLDESSAGLLFTHGDPTSPLAASTYGADFKLRSNISKSGALEANGWFITSSMEVDGISRTKKGDAYGGDIAVNLDGDVFKLGYFRLDDSYDPAAGFVNRSGIDSSSLKYEKSFWSKNNLIRLYKPSVEISNIESLNSEEYNTLLQVSPVYFENSYGDSIRLFKKYADERIDSDFKLLGDVSVSSGVYETQSGGMQISTSGSRIAGVSWTWESGSLYETNFITNKGYVIYRPVPRLNFRYDFNVTNIENQNERNQYAVNRLVTEFAFTSNVLWSNYLQKDFISDTYIASSKLFWQPSLYQSVYFILGRNYYRAADESINPQVTFTLKWSYLLRH